MHSVQFNLIYWLKNHTIVLFILVLLCWGCQQETPGSENVPTELFFESDLETVATINNELVFTTTDSNYVLNGAAGSNTDYAHSGTHSLRVDANHPYGLTAFVDNLEGYKFLSMSVWVHESSVDGFLLVSIKEKRGEKIHTATPDNDTSENGWIRQTISFMITPEMESIGFHVFSGKNIAYFDDLSVHFYLELPENELPNHLHLSIPDSSKETLDEYMGIALQKRIIPADCKKYVSGSLLIDGNPKAVELKLKGDWTDHLPSGKESYRIKITSEVAYNGLKSFSIQHPRARNYLNEWIVHQMADREDVLTTTYDFLNVHINDEFRGVYALEEHFDKQLLESRARREGPILKFDESAYWAGIEVFHNQDSLRQLPYFEQSPIGVFKKNRTRKSPQLSKQFIDASKLLWLFKQGHADVASLFDLDQLAKFYALMEVSGGWHALRWHNRRFYFNPVTQKLEHIAYDILPFNTPGQFKSNFYEKLNAPELIRELSFDNTLLYNEEFKSLYFEHVDRMTETAYLDSLFSDLDSSINQYLTAIKGEMSYYEFDRSAFYKNAAFLRGQLPELDALWSTKIHENQFSDWIKPVTYEQREDNLFIKEISVNAYPENKNAYTETVLENYHLNAIQVLGYQIKEEKKEDIWLKEPITLSGFSKIPDTDTLSTTFSPRKIYFTAENLPGDTLKKKVMRWAKPNGISTRMELEAAFNTESDQFTINQNELRFSGQVVIDEILTIPNEYVVTVMPGTEIEFKNGGGLIVSNNFFAPGTESHPIRIFSADSSSNGLTILQGDMAYFRHVSIEGLSNLNYKNWELTGAVTVYETHTVFKNCTISNTYAEDALNVIRSDVQLDELTLQGTNSDGLDLDFCTGKIESCEFKNTGNDCVDISGSTIGMYNSKVSNSGDKGISAGEGSYLFLENITIDQVEIGIAAKDGSEVIGSEVYVSRAKVGFTAFQKKPEYAGATIELNKITLKAIDHETIIQRKSGITLDGNLEEGTLDLDIESAYEHFQ